MLKIKVASKHGGRYLKYWRFSRTIFLIENAKNKLISWKGRVKEESHDHIHYVGHFTLGLLFLVDILHDSTLFF